MNDLKNLMKKNTHKKKTTPFSDLLHPNIESVLDTEFKLTLQNLKSELDFTKSEKERLQTELNSQKEELRKREAEIDYLRVSNKEAVEAYQNLNSEYESNLKSVNQFSRSTEDCPEKSQEIKKLKAELLEKESNLDILNLKIEELTKSNKSLQALNDSLKEQNQRRKEKLDTEMGNLYSQIKELEVKKNELERTNKALMSDNQHFAKKDQDMEFLNKTSSSNDKKLATEMKAEKAVIHKKLEEIKSKYEKEIAGYKNEIFLLEAKSKEMEGCYLKMEKELKEKTESNISLKSQYEMIRNEIEITKQKFQIYSKNTSDCESELSKMKVEYDETLKKKESENKDLRDTLEMNNLLVERLKKMEKALRSELSIKDEEQRARQDMIKQARNENDRLSDEILALKKENYSLSSQLEMMDMEVNGRTRQENTLKENELKLLREKDKKYEKLVLEMKEHLKKKQNIIENKKRMNLMLIELAKIKKGEVQCLEALQYTESSNVRDTLAKIRENEKEILSR